MPDYDKIYERVVRRGDDILEQRRKKAVKIKQTSYAVSGVCAAVITGVGIWRMTNIKNLPENSFPEIETVEEVTTNTEKTSVPVITSSAVSATVTTRKTPASTVLTTEPKTSVTSKNTTAATVTESTKTSAETSAAATQNDTTAPRPEQPETSSTTAITATDSPRETTASQTAKTTTTIKQTSTYDTSSQTHSLSTRTSATTVNASNTTVSLSTNRTASQTTALLTENATISATTTTRALNAVDAATQESAAETNYMYPSIFSQIELPQNDVFRQSGNDNIVYCFARNIKNAEDVGELKEKIQLKGSYSVNGAKHDLETVASIFTFKEYSPAFTVAVKFDNSDMYYQYIAKQYYPATLGDLISAFDLSAGDLSSECKYWNTSITDVDKEQVWKMIASDTSLLNINSYCKENNITPYSELKFTLSNPMITGTLGIDSEGYLMVKINRITDVCFYIGKDKAEEIIEYISG